MRSLPIDTHRLAKLLEEAGFSQAQIEAQLAVLSQMVQVSDLATRADLRKLALRFKKELRVTETQLRGEIAALETRLRKETQELEAHLHKAMQELEARLRKEMQELEARLRKEIAESEARLRSEIEKKSQNFGCERKSHKARIGLFSGLQDYYWCREPCISRSKSFFTFYPETESDG